MSEKIISIGLTNQEYQNILEGAKKENMSISLYCKSRIIPEEIIFIKYYNYLMDKLEAFPSDNEFTLRDLFEDEIEKWDDIPNGIKVALGRHFYSKNKHREDIKFLGYSTRGAMKYLKIK